MPSEKQVHNSDQGAERGDGRRRGEPYDSHFVDKVLALFNTGHSRRHIAKQFGIPKGSMYRLISKRKRSKVIWAQNAAAEPVAKGRPDDPVAISETGGEAGEAQPKDVGSKNGDQENGDVEPEGYADQKRGDQAAAGDSSQKNSRRRGSGNVKCQPRRKRRPAGTSY